MSKEDLIEFSGKVVEARPNAMFLVKVNETEREILCTISGKIRQYNIRIIVGDAVDVEVSPYNLSLGRITFRHK